MGLGAPQFTVKCAAWELTGQHKDNLHPVRICSCLALFKEQRVRRPLHAHITHQPFDGIAGNAEPFARHLPPHLAHAVNSEFLYKRTRDFKLENYIPLCVSRQSRRVSPLCDMLVIG
jgi:hypothetical protein